MSAQLQVGDVLTKGTPTRKLVEELAGVYPLMLVVRGDEQHIEWSSDGWRTALHDVPELVGCSMRDVIARLPKPEQSFPIATRLRETGRVRAARVELRIEADTPAPFEVTVFELEPHAAETRVIVTARRCSDSASTAATASLLDALPDAVIAIDAQGFVDHANRAATALLACEPDALAGAAVAVLADDTVGTSRLLAALACDAPHEIEFDVRRDDAEPLAVVAHVSPRVDDSGERLGSIVSLRNRAQIEQGSHALSRRTEELEHCVNSLAHDLRSPLVALLGFSRLLRQDYGGVLDETGAHFVDRIEQAGHTMEGLIHDALELSRIGQQGEHPALLDPRAVLLQLAAEFKARLDEDAIELRLPESPPMVFCDRTRLYQVFCNLIGNAIEHMGDCRERRIDVTIDAEPGLHHIRVRDSGRGVAAENHERIFEAFQSLGARRDGRRGTGMGLAIVRKIAETRDGRAWVESSPEAGATFHVTLAEQ